MKMPSLLVLVSVMAVTGVAHAQKGTMQPRESTPAKKPEPPPQVWQDPDYRNPWVSEQQTPAPAAAPVYVYEQKSFSARYALVTQEQAETIINRFKEAYPKLGSPRLLIYVNRELVDEQSGMKLIKRQETIETSRSTGGTNDSAIRSTGENTYRSDGKTAPTLADKQTIRDVERLFGRPLRSAGASLADQRVASQLIADRPLAEFIGTTDTPQARKDREALSQVADAVIEILISSKNVTVPTISSVQTITVPDIQATAIRLKDSRVLAQVSSSDVTGRVPPSALSNIGVNEVAEATALALMEDLTLNP